MNVAVLGGSGLIGSAVSQRLAALGHRVTVLTRKQPAVLPPGCDWREADIVKAAALRSALEAIRPEAVLHLAAFLQFACEQDPPQAIRVNVDGTLHVLEACRALGVRRLVFASSVAAYGERTDLMREDDPPSARIGLYGMTKRLSEMLGSATRRYTACSSSRCATRA